MDNHCYKCGSNLPITLSFSGIKNGKPLHVKGTCSGCGCFVRFVTQTTIPEVAVSRQRIWAITNDLGIIEKCKSETVDNSKTYRSTAFEIYSRVYWHNVYVTVELVPLEGIPIVKQIVIEFVQRCVFIGEVRR